MAHPSSSHRDRDDDRATTRERTHRTSSSTHHHRTISSTTLLLVLSLILAVLAVMLSLPSRSSGVLPTPVSRGQQAPEQGPVGAEDGTSHSFWGYLTPGRSHALVSRESNVALREAEVARREAELLAGVPAGSSPYGCPLCGETVYEEAVDMIPSVALVQRPSPPVPAPAVTHTVIQEVIKEVEPANPSWLQQRLDTILEREMKISDREKEAGQREEAVGKREADATKREGWILEQLTNLQPPEIVEEVYDSGHPRHYYGEARRNPPKALPETVVVTETTTATETRYTNPPPAPTRVAARPTPETFVKSATAANPGKTQEVYVEVYPDYYEPPAETVVYEPGHGRRQWW